MNTYMTEKWNRSEKAYKTLIDTSSHFDQLNTPYFTIIKRDQRYTEQKPTNTQDNYPFYSKGTVDKYSYYGKKQRGNNLHISEGEQKDNEASNKYTRVIGYSKYNLKKARAQVNEHEQINNSIIIKGNLEKKDSTNSQSTSDNICDSKSINSLETTNTINEEDIDRVDYSYSNNKLKTEDFRQSREKRAKLRYLNSLSSNLNKYKPYCFEATSLEQDEYLYSKTVSERESFPSNKFSCYSSIDNTSKSHIYPGYLFNTFNYDGNFPFYNGVLTHQNQYNFGHLQQKNFSSAYSHSYFNLNKNEKTNLMEHLVNLKEECLSINKNSTMAQKEKSLIQVINDKAPEIEKIDLINKENSKVNEPNASIITVSIRISNKLIKRIELCSCDEAFLLLRTKQFCSENALNEKLFYSIYTRIKRAIDMLFTLPKTNDETKELFSSTYRVMMKVKRSHSFDYSSKGIYNIDRVFP